MIVKQTSEGWEIIFQRAHGVLAANISFFWLHAFRPKRWLETLLAVAEHDDGQVEFKGRANITDSGAPLHFTMKDINIQQPKRVGDHAYQKSRWISLLTSMHCSFLYEGKRGKDPKMDQLLNEQSNLQKHLLKSLDVPEKEALRAYHLLEWCDALSLILCQGLLQPEERKMEISTGPDGEIHQIWQRKKDLTLVVEPWCFEVDEFEVSVESRIIHQLQFKNDEDLEKALKSSAVLEKVWKFKRS